MLLSHLLLPFIPFALVSYFSFYVPGSVLLHWTKPKIEKGDFFLISWAIGVSLFLLGIYTFSWLRIPYGYLFVVIVLALYAILRKHEVFSFHFGEINWWIFGFILFGSLSFLGLTFWSGIMVGKNFQIVGITNRTDGLMHLAFIKNIFYAFPPQHAGLAGFALRGYHYFYDLLLSRFSTFYGFSPEDLQYRLFPLFMSILYGAGFYVFSKLLTRNAWSQVAVVFFAYFSQSWAGIIHLFIRTIDPSNGLGVVQPLELILDPSVIFSIGIFLLLLHLLVKLNNSVKLAIVIGVILGILCQLKVYIGIIAGISIFLFSLYEIFVKRKSKFSYCIIMAVASVLTAVTFLPNNLGAGTSLFFSPLFVYESFMQESYFSSWQWEIKRIIYSNHHNYVRLMQLYGEAIFLYWFLALGIKSVFILGMRNLFKKEYWLNEINVITILIIAIPVAIASLFVQSISIFDTKQFFWIAAALMAIPAGVVLGNILVRVPIFLKIAIIGFILFASFGSYYRNENGYFLHPESSLILQNQLNVFTAIHNTIHANEFSVVIPKYKERQNMPKRDNFDWYPAPLVAGMTGRNTFIEPEVAQFALDKVMVQRREIVYKIYRDLEECNPLDIKKTLDSIHTKFLVTFKNYSFCLDASGFLKQSYSSPAMYFYVF